MHIEHSPELSVSNFVKLLKGRSTRKAQDEFRTLKKGCWFKHFLAAGYGVWSTGNMTDEMVQEYLEHHRNPSNGKKGNIILESDFQFIVVESSR